MKRKGKHTSGIYAYLDSTGILANGTQEDIEVAKHIYWRQYRAAWHKNKRKAEKVFAVSLTNSELHVINKAAHTHKRSRTRFIKEAAMAYINKQYLVPDIIAFNEIKELLTIAYTNLRKLSEERLVPEVLGKYLLLKILELEKEIKERLEYPKTAADDH